jgi:hypothetical protein
LGSADAEESKRTLWHNPIMTTMPLRLGGTALTLLCAATAVAQTPQSNARAGNAVVAGELVVEPPTLINLGFEWLIEGDDNRNASVAVSFRARGDGEWRAA